jgi:hypothetical protein
VVPRTFLGSLATSLLVSPISMFFQATYAPKVTSMNVARAGLALISVACTSAFRWQLGRRFGTSVSVAYACVTIVQFHINFYASRALPNTFALALSNLAYSYLLRDDYRACMCILGFTAAVFRFEIVILATPILAMAIVRKRLPLGKALVVGLWGVAAGVAGALLSVCVDSVFWGRFVWPEFEGFVFNAVLNKSHEWGTSPFHWYLTSAIPRCMLGTPPTSQTLYQKRSPRPLATPLIPIIRSPRHFAAPLIPIIRSPRHFAASALILCSPKPSNPFELSNGKPQICRYSRADAIWTLLQREDARVDHARSRLPRYLLPLAPQGASLHHLLDSHIQHSGCRGGEMRMSDPM